MVKIPWGFQHLIVAFHQPGRRHSGRRISSRILSLFAEFHFKRLEKLLEPLHSLGSPSTEHYMSHEIASDKGKQNSLPILGDSEAAFTYFACQRVFNPTFVVFVFVGTWENTFMHAVETARKQLWLGERLNDGQIVLNLGFKI